MARGDYYGCAVCDGKAFYDANIDWEYQAVGGVLALCTDCIKTHGLEVSRRPKRVEFPIKLYCWRCKADIDSDQMALPKCPVCKVEGGVRPRSEKPA